MFSTVKITNTTNSDTDKWQDSGYGIGFDSKKEFTDTDGSYGGNVIIFEADLSNSRHSNNKTKNILVLGREFVQKINDTTIYEEKMHSPNFTVDNKTFCLGLHYNGDNSYLFVNGKQVIKFKSKNSELIKYRMCLAGLSKDYNNNNHKDTGLYGNVYDISVDYSAITSDKIVDIHNYLMKKNYVI